MSRSSSTRKTTMSLESCGWEMSNRSPKVRSRRKRRSCDSQSCGTACRVRKPRPRVRGETANCGCARTGGTGSQPLNNREQVHCLVRHHCSLRALSDVLVPPHGIVSTRRRLLLRRALHGSRKASKLWTVTYPEASPKRLVVSESSFSVGAVPREPCGNHHRLR